MPTYEYRCKDCGHGFDVVQAFTDDPLTECPSCAGNLKKVFGNVGITFKGSGFYKTDSRSSANGGTKKTETAGDSGSSSGDSSSTSSKDSGSSKESSSSSKDGGSSKDSSSGSSGSSTSAAAPA